jgi:Mrp family chromosome partitioning ATPase
MSRNFDLLAEIERERERERRTVAPDAHAQASPEPSVVSEAPSRETGQSNNGSQTREAQHASFAMDTVEAVGEEILRMVHTIFLTAGGVAPRQVVFCGVGAESASSTVCASAGRALAANCTQSVCLVDANLRSPRLTEIFGVDSTIPIFGKTAVIREHCTQIHRNLWFAGTDLLTDGRGSLLSVDELKQRFAQLFTSFEFLLIDAPGAGVSGDAAHLGQACDAGVLVIEANSTRRLSARKAKEALESAGVRLLGTVLHNRLFPIPEGLYKRI